MADIVILGLSHRSAPLALREKLAVPADGLEPLLAELRALGGVTEVIVLSTCNRVEVYAAASDADRALDTLRAHLLGRAGGPDAASHFYERVGSDAIRHLFRVAASLDSLVVGEPQILGQVKEAHGAAERCGAAGPALGMLFQRAFRVARKVRRETEIARNPVSVSTIAVDLVRQVFAGFEGRQILVVGAGKMAAEAARAFRSHGASLTVTNRTAERAAALAATLAARVHPWGDLAGAIEHADVVLASTGAREPVIGRALLAAVQRARRGRPLFLVDIAVPRDVDPACADLPGVFLADIDNLHAVAALHLGARREEAARGEAMVDDEVRRFVEAARGRGVGPAITALRAHFHEVVRAEAERLLGGMPGLGERDRRAVQAAFEAAANKLLHAPQMALKKSAAAADGVALVDALRDLFELPPVAVADADTDAEAAVDADASSQAKKAAT